MATYRVGPSSGFLGLGTSFTQLLSGGGAPATFSPSDLQADADTLNGQVALLDAAFQAAGGVTPGSDLVNAWVLYQGDWAAFYADHFASWIDKQLTAWNDSNRDQLVQFEERFATIRDRMKALGVDTASEDVNPNLPTDDGSGTAIWLTIVITLALVIAGIVFLSRVTK